MSVFTVLIIGIILIGVFSFDILRKSKLKILNGAMEAKNYEAVEAIAQSKTNRMLLTNYTCDLYLLRAYFLRYENEAFLPYFFEVYAKQSEEEHKKEFLEIYFHLFLYKNQEECAKQLLEKILNTTNESFKTVSQYAYDIVFTKESSQMAEIETLVETLRSFDLGVAAYYLGRHFDLLGNTEMAEAYLQSCLGCFNGTHYYAIQAKKRVEEIEAANE